MKKLAFLLALASLAAGSTAALDFGGSIDSATTVEQADSLTLKEEATLSGWARLMLGKSLELYTRGSYTYTIDTPVLLDLDAGWLKGEWDTADGPSLFELTLGRFRASDFSRLVLDHTLDGFQLAFSYPNAVLRASAGFTGLIQKPRSDIVISKTDEADVNRAAVLFAPPRLVGSFGVELLNVLGSQSLKLAMLFQEDLRLDDDNVLEAGEENFFPNQGGLLDTQYLGAGLSGPLGGSLYYDLFVFGNTGQMLSYVEDDESITSSSYQYEPIVAFLGGAGVRYFAPVLSSVVGLRALYASGDEDAISVVEGNTDGWALAFIPISQSDRALVFSPQLGNLLVGEASFSIKPFGGLGVPALANLQAMVKVMVFGRPTTGPVSEGGIDPASDSMYLGSEVDVTINYRPFSDLGIALNGGVFLPGDAIHADRSDPEYVFGLLVSLSF